jgi:predicted O-linked N-acetylglucosamine transferase (SPINDLY family)
MSQTARHDSIGYVSGDLCDHPVARFIGPVFETYSRSEFQVFCYSNRRVEDAVSARMRESTDCWRNVSALSDDELANLIRDDGIDILVDLSGHTALNRLLVFARKPAPVQVTMIGYMQTTGMTAMDYRITDEALDPIGTSEHLSTEELIRLPAGAAPFQPPPDCPPVDELAALKNGYVTFASFNNLTKITPEVTETWARVLQAAPGSKMLIVGRNGSPVGAAVCSHGIAPERLEILERQPMQAYLALHNRVDLILDAFPYNGGTTNLIAAWMGVPFVTIAGNTTVSRVGEAVLKLLGLPELVATGTAEYVRKAADTVKDLDRLSHLRSVMRPRLQAWGGDGSVFTKQLEQAFREIWRRWCEAQASARVSAGEARVPAPAVAAAPIR